VEQLKKSRKPSVRIVGLKATELIKCTSETIALETNYPATFVYEVKYLK
jgi:hypothetical protein